MACAEDVVGALGAAQEAARPVRLLDRAQALASPRQHLVAVGLVADVPDDAVAWRVEDPVQADAELDGAEAAGEVAADLGADLYEEGPQLVGHLPQAFPWHAPEIGGLLDAREPALH